MLPAWESYFAQQMTSPDERTSSSWSCPRPRRRCGRSSRRRLEPTTETSARHCRTYCCPEEAQIGLPEVRSGRLWGLASSQRHRNRIWNQEKKLYQIINEMYLSFLNPTPASICTGCTYLIKTTYCRGKITWGHWRATYKQMLMIRESHNWPVDFFNNQVTWRQGCSGPGNNRLVRDLLKKEKF